MSKRAEKQAAKYQARKERTQAAAGDDKAKHEDPHYDYDNKKGKWVPKK